MAAHQNHIWKFGEKNNTWALVFWILKSEWRLFYEMVIVIISVQFSRSIVFNSLWPHELQHTRLPCPLASTKVGSNSCSLSQWWQPTISSSVTPFSSCPQCFPASGSFPISRLFTSGGQSIGASASASVFPMNIQGWFPLGLTGWSPCCPRDSEEASPAPQFKSINSSVLSLLCGLALTSVYDYCKKNSSD